MSKEVRNNPPSTIVTVMQGEFYRVLYDDITRDGKILQYQDRHVLAELAILSCEIVDLRRDITENGVMMKVQGDRNEVTKRNGACDVLATKLTAYHRLFKAFGMAPEYRPKMSGGEVPVQPTDDGFDDLVN